MVFQNCGEFASNSGEDGEKLAFLSGKSVFGVTRKEAFEEINRPTADVGTVAVKQVAGNVRVTNFCTNSFTYNLGTTTGVEARLLNSAGQSACKLDGVAVKEMLLNLSDLSFANLRQQCGEAFAAGTYRLVVTRAGTSDPLVFDGSPVAGGSAGINVQFSTSLRDGTDQIALTSPRAYVLYHYNNGAVAGTAAAGGNRVQANAELPQPPANTNPALCAEAGEVPPPPPADPLLIQLSDGYAFRQVRLSPITRGVMFDIMGEAGQPQAHVKQMISWFADTATASYNAWLVKPNSSNQVNSVDEMMGDRTKGPDGLFAENGFEALRKWDGRLNYLVDGQDAFSARARDGKIDANDSVFSDLRLWLDKNNDGVAQSEELVPLTTAGVVSIDLNYDKNFSETDVYGNEIKFKSVVRMKDGRLNLIYDIFFRTL